MSSAISQFILPSILDVIVPSADMGQLMMSRVLFLHIWGLVLLKTLLHPLSNKDDMFSSAAGSDCRARVVPPLMRRSRCSIKNITQVKNPNCIFEAQGRERLLSKQDHTMQKQDAEIPKSGRGSGITTRAN